jgi:hypothetical protein
MRDFPSGPDSWQMRVDCQHNARVQTTLDAREITVLISGLFLTACSVRFRVELQRVPQWRVLAYGMACLVIGNVATIVEHFVAYDLFNDVEHLCYFLQSLALAAWALRLRRLRKAGVC